MLLLLLPHVYSVRQSAAVDMLPVCVPWMLLQQSTAPMFHDADFPHQIAVKMTAYSLRTITAKQRCRGTQATPREA